MNYLASPIIKTFLPFLLISILSSSVQAQPSTAIPVRNEMPRVGQREVIMMRHAALEKGGYAHWYQHSSENVWPWYERLGARMIGDFQIIYPDTSSPSPNQDEALRFARYASYEHWQATRGAANSGDTGGSFRLAGNGELYDASITGIRGRREVMQSSKGGTFLQGYMAPTRPLYMPGTAESFAVVQSQDNSAFDEHPVRLAAAKPGDEILLLRYRKIKKGSFEEFYALSSQGTWPYLEKIGMRPVGQWQVVYLPEGTPVESVEYDELYTLARFASWEHYQAMMDSPVSLGGDGPDYEKAVETLQLLDQLTLESSVQFLKGPLFGSPPQYTPPMDGAYRVIE